MVEQLFAFADRRGLVVRFGKRPNGSLQLGLERPNAYIFPFFFYPAGVVEVTFQSMLGVPYPPFHHLSKRQELLEKLNSLEGFDLPAERIALRPNFSLRLLEDKNRFDKFLEIFEWTLREAEASAIGTANLEDAKQERDSGADDAP